jgi:predicted metalloprotease with PDZ domain
LSFEGHLYIEIVDTDGYPVEEAGMGMRGDCGRRSYRVTEGEADLMVDEGLCTLIAWRQDGALRTLSDRVEVDVLGGDEVDITLVLPAERTGGLGVQIEQDDAGMRVVMVVPGSPAERAGLQAGDLITEVDGTSTGLLSMQDFVQVMTGPEGTDIDFVVQYDEDTGIVAEPIVVTRAFLDG